jgi:hypothetical protein
MKMDRLSPVKKAKKDTYRVDNVKGLIWKYVVFTETILTFLGRLVT